MPPLPHDLEGEFKLGAMWVAITSAAVIAAGAVMFGVTLAVIRLGGRTVTALRRVHFFELGIPTLIFGMFGQ